MNPHPRRPRFEGGAFALGWHEFICYKGLVSSPSGGRPGGGPRGMIRIRRQIQDLLIGVVLVPHLDQLVAGLPDDMVFDMNCRNSNNLSEI